MRLANTLLLVLLFLCIELRPVQAQDSSLYARIYSLPDKLFNRINERSERIADKLSKQTDKYLTRLYKQEKRLQRKLRRKDSTAAKQLFGDIDSRYEALRNKANTDKDIYAGHLDSVETALKFLQTKPGVPNNWLKKAESVSAGFSTVKDEFDHAAEVKEFIKERQQFLKDKLANFALTKEFRKFQEQIYYYRSQVDEYKQMLEDPSKMEAKLLELANKIPAFKEFFAKNSILASMFSMPGNNGPTISIAGLQTRESMQQLFAARFGTGQDVNRAMRQNMKSAQSQLSELKDKMSSVGENGADLDMPDFKPNNYKTKSFWQRIELGTNIQTARRNGYFPTTSDVALSAGYRLNNKSTIGLGASYKVGWGKDIRHVRMSSEGVGLRSFIDWQIKGSISITGGFEYNYQQPFSNMRQLHVADQWQQSGLIGVSKTVSIQSKFFKKTRFQLLWDFLSYEQTPRPQPFKVRVGYSF